VKNGKRKEEENDNKRKTQRPAIEAVACRVALITLITPINID